MTTDVLQEIERAGKVTLPTGESVPVHSHIGPSSAAVIRRAIVNVRPAVACEVGLAFGISTLNILDAMQTHGGGRLIGIDPAQNDGTWRGAGLHNIRRAGFGSKYEFIEESSQRALPRLEALGTRIQFAFIDGWHTFDHTLLDFFYIDQMLDDGGIVVLDDVGYPSLRKLCHFIVSNRDYEIFDADPRTEPRPRHFKARAKRVLQRVAHPLVRDDFTPTRSTLALEEVVDSAQLIALRKRGSDRRRFDHFVAF